jgi:hypothetical protein
MPVTRQTRRLVLARARRRCEYCQISGWPLTIDHIVPVGRWAPPLSAHNAPAPAAASRDALDNLAAACWLCNRAKSDALTARDPLGQTDQPLFNPRTQRWEDHFDWSSSYATLIGTTATGRATVAQLRLNRREHRAQRALLRAAARGGGPHWP